MFPFQAWKDDTFRGTSSTFSYGVYPDVSVAGMPHDAITSWKIAPFTRVELFEKSNYGGEVIDQTGPAEIAKTDRLNDKISSIIVHRIEPTDQFKYDCYLGNKTPAACGEFQPGTQAMNGFMRGYCRGKNLETDGCRRWALANPGACDLAAIEYCAGEGAKSPFCACILSPASKLGANPACYDQKCIAAGYRTAGMIEGAKNCPSVINCELNVDLINSGVQVASIPISQQCGNSATTPAETGPASQQSIGVLDSIGVETGLTGDEQFYVVLGGGLLVLILLAIVIAALVGGDAAVAPKAAKMWWVK